MALRLPGLNFFKKNANFLSFTWLFRTFNVNFADRIKQS